ncbi:hypothetical protein [Streptomyces halobius]|uniref:Uncharacterized protein n=1 Tax=Streptomyces halobius TaxID=2879846 RepID=A0ABY4M0S5_9ACTN|nr:hypothetical protein [Streptomyces halobius]UQA91356.1 hypothetical protein K9S39_05215 [Streptomyces halobius]
MGAHQRLELGRRVPPHPCNGGGIPGFASRKMAAYFVYRYNKPEPSGRKD